MDSISAHQRSSCSGELSNRGKPLALTVASAGLLQFRTLAGEFRVHCVRRQIDLSRPRHRAAINENLPEELHVTQGRQYTGQFFLPQTYTPCQPVFESDKAVVRLRLHFNYVPIH